MVGFLVLAAGVVGAESILPQKQPIKTISPGDVQVVNVYPDGGVVNFAASGGGGSGSFPPVQTVAVVDGGVLPISAASLPLPSGASTSSNQTTIINDLLALSGQLPAALDGSGYLKTHEQGTAAISASSLPLPTGAATSAKQDTLSAQFPSTLDGSGFLKTHEQGTATVSGAVGVNNFPPTYLVTLDGGHVDATAFQGGTWNINNISGTVSLPTGAAQDSTLTGGTLKAEPYDGTNVIGTSAHPIRTDPTNTTSTTVQQATASNLNATVTESGTWADNITQFGGSNVVTGTGASGSGIPRVTLSNDSSLAANQTVLDNSDGTVAPGTAASKSSLGGLVYNTSAPAPTNGQQVALQGDPAANLRITHAPLQASGTLGSLNALVSVTLQGHTAVSYTNTTGSTLVATLTPSCIFGGSGNTVATNFINATTGAQTATQVTVSGTAYNLGIQICPGATGVQVQATAYTSGTATGFLNAVYSVNQTAPLPAGTNVIGALSANQSVNLAQIAGGTAVTGGGTGILAVGGGAANGGTLANPVPVALEAQNAIGGSAGTVSNGKLRSIAGSIDGVLFTRTGGPITWHCSLGSIGTTLTTCQAAPGASTSLYITDIVAQSSTSTAGNFTLTSGTGTNCGTTNVALFANSTSVSQVCPPNTAAAAQYHFMTPMKLPANTQLCVLGVATNTTHIEVLGYSAP